MTEENKISWNDAAFKNILASKETSAHLAKTARQITRKLPKGFSAFRSKRETRARAVILLKTEEAQRNQALLLAAIPWGNTQK